MSHSKEELKQAIYQWVSAFESKNLDKMMEFYHTDSVMFDCCPPYKTVGKEAIYNNWSESLHLFPNKFTCRVEDLVFDVDGNMGYAHFLNHLDHDDKNHPIGQSWLRVSAVYKKINGKWYSVHEHISLPYNPMNNQVCMIKDLDDLFCGVNYPEVVQ